MGQQQPSMQLQHTLQSQSSHASQPSNSLVNHYAPSHAPSSSLLSRQPSADAFAQSYSYQTVPVPASDRVSGQGPALHAQASIHSLQNPYAYSPSHASLASNSPPPSVAYSSSQASSSHFQLTPSLQNQQPSFFSASSTQLINGTEPQNQRQAFRHSLSSTALPPVALNRGISVNTLPITGYDATSSVANSNSFFSSSMSSQQVNTPSPNTPYGPDYLATAANLNLRTNSTPTHRRLTSWTEDLLH